MYLRRSDGMRPAVYVAFLDLEADPGAEGVNGTLRPVSEAELDLLDRRERNYDRVDVTGDVDGIEGPVWTYVGSPEGRERLRRGRREGTRRGLARLPGEGARRVSPPGIAAVRAL